MTETAPAPVTLWGRKNSVNVQKVTWFAAEIGLRIDRIDAGGAFGRLDSPEFKALSPLPQIPVLVDARAERTGGAPLAIWESAAALRYLADAEGSETFWPKHPARRAEVDRWAEWAQVGLHQGFQRLFVGIVRTPASERNLAALAALRDQTAACLQTADTQLDAQPWLAGDTMTLADILLGAALYRVFTLDVDFPQTPALQAYYGRLTERPAYAAHVMIDYDAMRVPGAERGATPVV